MVTTLLKFAKPLPNRQGVFDEGVRIRDTGYLDLRSITKVWGDEAGATWYTNLGLGSGLFHRGLLIKCPFCRNADWYRMADLSDRAICSRCSREHVYDADAAIYFKLDELATLALRLNSHVPLLALDWLRRSSTSFQFVTGSDLRRHEVEGSDDKPWLEVDFLAVVDGALVIGESKSGQELSAEDRKQLTRYCELCKVLRPDRLIVCTDTERWASTGGNFLAGLAQQLADLGVELQSLTGTDLGWPPAAEPVQPG